MAEKKYYIVRKSAVYENKEQEQVRERYRGWVIWWMREGEKERERERERDREREREHSASQKCGNQKLLRAVCQF